MNDFGEMYQRQAALQHEMYGDLENLSMEERIAVTKDMCLHLQSEIIEFLGEMAWKAKRRQSPHVVRGNLLDESIDVIKMAMTLPILWGFTAEEVHAAFHDKSMVVEQRYRQEFPLYEIIEAAERLGKPSIVALDIDGVLSEWPYCFYDFVDRQHPGELRLSNAAEHTDNPFEALTNSPITIRQWKDEYRQSGVKRTLPTVTGSVDFTQTLRRMGFQIVLLTARPYKQYSRTFADTMYWLDTNEYAYDAILWGENKEERLAQEFSVGTVAMFVDDNERNVDRVRAAGFNAHLLGRPYNQSTMTFADILSQVAVSNV